MLSLLYSSGMKRSERLGVHAGQCPSNLYSQQQIIQSPESVLLRRFKSPTSPFYYHEEPLAMPSSSTTTSTSSSATASTSTSTQLIVDLSMVTKEWLQALKLVLTRP